MASTIASSVSVLIEKPATYRNVTAPISETGMVTSGIIVARQSRRNTKITSATSTIASRMVVNTLEMDSSMNTEESNEMISFIPSGKRLVDFRDLARAAWDRSSALAVDCRIRPSDTEGLPL